MKHWTLFILISLWGTVSLFGTPEALAPETFFSTDVWISRSPEWRDTFARELQRLATSDRFSPAAVKAAGQVCRESQFPDSPHLAAALTVLTIRESDTRLRFGLALAAVKVKAKAAWGIRLKYIRRTIHPEKNISEKLKKDLGIAGGKEQSLPKDKEKKDKKIDDKIKEKKDKKK
jgi:hypothetical protein